MREKVNIRIQGKQRKTKKENKEKQMVECNMARSNEQMNNNNVKIKEEKNIKNIKMD